MNMPAAPQTDLDKGSELHIGDGQLVVIAGPCMAESLELCLQVAAGAMQCCQDLGLKYVFKASFDKANRTSVSSQRGPGMEKGLKILATVKKEFECPVITDVHETWQCEPVAEVVDIIQIPAFLSRQTDLLLAAGRTGKVVNVKKGQFMAPEDMKQVAEKIMNLIAQGGLAPGERLPSVRNLALDLSVNPNTVQKAFAELERQGLVQSERTSGRFVSIDDQGIEELRKDISDAYIAEMFANLRKLGMDDRMIKDAVKHWEDKQ